VYAFGEVLAGADPLDAVEVAVAINLAPEEVPWESTPEGTDWLANELRRSKGGFTYFWRSYLDPVWNLKSAFSSGRTGPSASPILPA
jgi:hypothetical protein